jgi:hypothetical protein
MSMGCLERGVGLAHNVGINDWKRSVSKRFSVNIELGTHCKELSGHIPEYIEHIILWDSESFHKVSLASSCAVIKAYHCSRLR